jgi:hypothetical protein
LSSRAGKFSSPIFFAAEFVFQLDDFAEFTEFSADRSDFGSHPTPVVEDEVPMLF